MASITTTTASTTTTMPASTGALAAVIFEEPKDICEICENDKAAVDDDGDMLCSCDICEGCDDEVGYDDLFLHSGLELMCLTCSMKDGPICRRDDCCEVCDKAYRVMDGEDQEKVYAEEYAEFHKEVAAHGEMYVQSAVATTGN
jgi:hypothetical protein